MSGYVVEVRRGSAWRTVDATTDAALAYLEVNQLRRGQRRRVAVRLLRDGAQVRYWPPQGR